MSDLLLFICVCVYVCGPVCRGVSVELEDNLWESVVFHSVSLRGRTQVVRLGCKHLYLLTHLAGLGFLSSRKQEL